MDTERNDKYSQDIYEPDYNAHNEDTFELAYDDIDNNDYYPDNESHVEDIQPDYMSNDYMSDDEVTGAAPEDVTGYVESSYEDETPYDNDEIFENDVTNEEHKEKTEKEPEQVKPVHKPKKVYKFPPVSLLKRNPGTASGGKAEYRVTAQRLQETLLTFGVKVTITDISCGPTVTRYELQPEQGVKVSKIVSLSDDIKLNLATADIRIEAPIPGKAAIGIEVPNKEAGSVYFRELVESKEFKESQSAISFGVGKDIAGKTIIADIAKMPHMLIAGATGSGKSVCINTIIMSILYKAKPEDVRLIMVDPKVVELSVYNGIPHLLLPVVTDPKKAAGALNWAVNEMTDRYKKFAAMQVRNIKGYNDVVVKKNKEGIDPPMEKLPQIVIIIDELTL